MSDAFALPLTPPPPSFDGHLPRFAEGRHRLVGAVSERLFPGASTPGDGRPTPGEPGPPKPTPFPPPPNS